MFVKRLNVVFCIVLLVSLSFLLATAGAQERVKIKYAFWGNPMSIGIEEEIIKQFQKTYPNIEIEPIAAPHAEYHTKLLTMIAGGLAPDVMRINSYYFADFMDANALMNLDPLIERDNIDLSLYYEMGLPESMYEGKMYGLPWGTAPLYLAYNIKMFKDTGIDVPRVGWTWEDFVETARSIAGGSGIERKYGYGAPFTNIAYFLPFIWAAGGDIFDQTKSKFTLDQPQAVKRLDEIASLIREGVFANPLELPTEEAVTRLFAQNLIAIRRASAAEILGMQNIEGLDFEVIHCPTGEDIPNTTVVKSNTVGISVSTKHPEEAWEFLKFLRAPGGPGDRLYAKAKRIPPTSKIPELWDLYLDPTKPPRKIKEITQLISSTYGRTLPLRKGWLEIEGVLIPALQKTWSAGIEAKTAITEVKAEIEEIMKSKN
ncbi:sugar ABC transporter substrate-binding protein [Thermatribacter velox]|uniref:Sugar ABC transporter substrate-binding protein n=1 Tax=Thermatribacter velox TaxID=3039681 RepID=A0ABZ2YFP3_9BACT